VVSIVHMLFSHLCSVHNIFLAFFVPLFIWCRCKSWFSDICDVHVYAFSSKVTGHYAPHNKISIHLNGVMLNILAGLFRTFCW